MSESCRRRARVHHHLSLGEVKYRVQSGLFDLLSVPVFVILVTNLKWKRRWGVIGGIFLTSRVPSALSRHAPPPEPSSVIQTDNGPRIHSKKKEGIRRRRSNARWWRRGPVPHAAAAVIIIVVVGRRSVGAFQPYHH